MTAKQYIQSCILIFTAALVMSSCVRKELPAPEKPKRITSSVDLGQKYTSQCYFSLEKNMLVATNDRDDWSLSFEGTADGFHVMLNPARNMYIYPTTKTDFASVKFADRGEELWDKGSGTYDSSAIGDWRINGYVYIIKEGSDVNDADLGYSKIQILSVDANGYKIRVSKINGSHDVTLDVPKDAQYNSSFILLGNDPKVLTVEPPKDTWDIVFTRYTYTFYEPYSAYLVVGALLNRNNTTAAMIPDTTIEFENVTMEDAKKLILKNNPDVIGYDWKTLVSDPNEPSDVIYEINEHKLYIVKTQSGVYYKLRFVDFYNDKKEKGAPKWESQQL